MKKPPNNLEYKGKWVFNWFSNMLPLDEPFWYQAIQFKTVENFYQAMKFPKDDLIKRKQAAIAPPHVSKTMLRNNKHLWRKDWTREESLKVMEYALRIKFAEGTSWHKKLMETEGEIIEWNNWGDDYWGIPINTEIGKNNLGKILMKIRDERL